MILPPTLHGLFPKCRWDQAKLWALSTPVTLMSTHDLWWLLDLPVWPTNPPASIFDLAPTTVMRNPELYPRRWNRILAADTGYPIELYRYNNRWIILDGYHRLARMFLEEHSTARVRLHPSDTMSRIVYTG
jgi:hypothetical protein